VPVDLLGDEWDESLARPGYSRRDFWAAHRLGAVELGASVYELPPGECTWPYHYHHGNEEWLAVLAGTPTLRTPEGERELRAGEVVCFPAGPDGAHQVVNGGNEPARILLLSTMNVPSVSAYPDSDKVGVRGGDEAFVFPRRGAVDYWEGE
jgi:uncharacterized cupin superfamily protein